VCEERKELKAQENAKKQVMMVECHVRKKKIA
jgi:hypothetical protein